MAGAAVTMESWRHEAPAILLAWYPGMEGGAALADVLLGAAEPGGRLPFAVPRDEADLPPFDRDATGVTYDRWHGQRRLDRDGVAPAYPLGFGLSYTRFRVGDVSVAAADGALAVSATVENTGDRAGGHVVQVYERRPERVLLDFARVELAAGGRARVRLTPPLDRLSTKDGQVRVEVGSYAGDPDATVVDLTL